MKPLSEKQLSWYIGSMLNHAIEAHEKGEKLPWNKPWSNVKAVESFNMMTGRVYSLINQMFLPSGGFIPQKALNKEGLRVPKEQYKKPYIVHQIFPIFGEDDQENPKKWGQTITPVYHFSQLEEESQKKAMEKYNSLQQYQDAQDAEPKTNIDNNNKIDRHIQKYIDQLNGGVTFGANSAYYVPSSDSITMPDREQFNTESEFYSTFLHEIMHSTGHLSRCNRTMSGGFGSIDYAIEELIAELGASALCRLLGVDYLSSHVETEKNTKAYLTGWLDKCKNHYKQANIVTNVNCGIKSFKDITGIE